MNLKRSLFLYLDEQDGTGSKNLHSDYIGSHVFHGWRDLGIIDFLSSNTAYRRDLLPVKNTMILLESWLNESKNKSILCKLWSQFQVFESLLFLVFSPVRHLWMTHSPALNFPLRRHFHVACQQSGHTQPWSILLCSFLLSFHIWK